MRLKARSSLLQGNAKDIEAALDVGVDRIIVEHASILPER